VSYHEFCRNATPQCAPALGQIRLMPREYTTGSFGFAGGGNQRVTLKLANGQEVFCTVMEIKLVVENSKFADRTAPAEETAEVG